MNKIRSFVQSRGGTATVARELGKSQSTVSTWIKREAIPFGNWKDFVEVGVSWEELLELHKRSNQMSGQEAHAVA